MAKAKAKTISEILTPFTGGPREQLKRHIALLRKASVPDAKEKFKKNRGHNERALREQFGAELADAVIVAIEHESTPKRKRRSKLKLDLSESPQTSV